MSDFQSNVLASEIANLALSIDNGIRPTSLFNLMRDWGFYLLPKSHQDSPGYQGLIVAIREKPSQSHFNPEVVRLQIGLSGAPGQKWETLRLNPLFHGNRPMYPGFITLLDNAGRQQQFFTFGGSIEVTQQDGETIYLLRSPAPILLIGNPVIEVEEVSEAFAEGFHTMLAQAHAWWKLDDQGFADRLMQTDPMQLYLACVSDLLAKYESNVEMGRHAHGFVRQLTSERQWLQESGRWPLYTPSVKTLLSPKQ